ncbi:MAG: nuclear transport factor 2 family protein [Proteobacteria bacterium]|nr:nuclear transport factor 2 family protein [Pseudomonadota bacterium]
MSDAIAAVSAIIQAQCAAWNNADLEGFVSYVGQDVIYVTDHGLVRGREALLEAYRGDWRDKGGELTVAIEEAIDHGASVTVVVQFWLQESSGPRSGWSLLTFAQNEGRWELIADATLRSRS